jgi:hypothetical protein
MKAVTQFVALLFGPCRRAGPMTTPGDADCRWRTAVALNRPAVNDDGFSRPGETPAAGGNGGMVADDRR